MDFIAALNKATGAGVTRDDYQAWMDCESVGDMDKFDATVRMYLGDALYNAADVCARLETVLLVQLGVEVHPAHENDLAKAIVANPSKYESGF